MDRDSILSYFYNKIVAELPRDFSEEQMDIHVDDFVKNAFNHIVIKTTYDNAELVSAQETEDFLLTAYELGFRG